MPVYMIYAAAFALSCLAGVDKKRLVLSAVLFLCGVLSLATYCMALYFIGRHMFFAMSITVAAMMVLFGELLKKGRTVPPTVYAACMAVLFLFNFCLGAVDICVLYSHSLRREAYIESALENGEKDLVFEIHSPRTEYAASAGLLDLSEDPEGWPNYSIALYYGLDSITGYYP